MTATIWRAAFKRFASDEGVVWAFIFKLLLANFIALWLAYRFELPQPTTVMATVCIVMQRHSGEVLAKSFWRVIGTLLGLTVMVALIAVFNQQPVLFLTAMAGWIGLCTAGAARYRDFRSYACVLAGYTAAIIGLPSSVHPDEAFMIALWRVLEIGLGIVCATLVSALVLPQSTSKVLRQTLALRMHNFAKAVISGLNGHYDPALMHPIYAEFAAQAVTLESLRNASSFEDPHMRLKRGRVGRLNHDFMVLAARLHALSQLLARLDEHPVKALKPCTSSLTELIKPVLAEPFTEQQASALAWRLDQQRQHLMQQIRDQRETFKASQPTEKALLEFNTGAELLYRLHQDLHTYATSHASLSERLHVLEKWPESFSTKANGVAAMAFGLRTTLLLLGISVFWLASAWPSGTAAVQAAGLAGGLSAVARQPVKQAWALLIGALGSAIVGFFLMFWVYPLLDGFVLLCCVLTPVLAFGGWLLCRLKTGGIGAGFLLWFCINSIPSNPAIFTPDPYLNTYLATLFGMLLSALTMSWIFHPERPWLWRRMANDLRKQVALAATRPYKGLNSYFASSTQDLLQQAILLTNNHPSAQRHILRLSFCIQEVGHAIIELRLEQSRLPLMQCYADYMPWQIHTRACLRALARLFISPTELNLERAFKAIDLTLNALHTTYEPFAPHFESSPLRRIASYLHFIRSALLNPKTPLLENTL